MSSLEVRKIPFDFSSCRFIWNPENPGFSIFMNQISFFAIAFERYLCRAMREAEARITDDEVLEEARLFREQEAVHSLAHRKHARELIRHYPALQATLDKAIESYDKLYEAKPLDYHLAYGGGLEAIFTPFFKMILDHRAALFSGGDARLASLFLWHFCEEIEHRSSALTIYNHVVGSYWYRLRNTAGFKNHSAGLFAMLATEFKKHVTDVPKDYFELSPFTGIPRTAMIKSTLGILNSQAPWHNPDHQALPDYYEEWMAHWNAGADVRQVYGKPFDGAPS